MNGANEVVISGKIHIRANELTFRTSRSSGPGGQNVNKLETKVELEFNVRESRSLTEDQKRTLLDSLRTRIGIDGILRISSQRSRSQWANKEDAVRKLTRLLEEALKPRRKRVRTIRTASAQERRIRTKKLAGLKKSLRRFKEDHDD